MINCIILLNADIKDDVVMTKQPIMKFNDLEEANKWLDYYKEKLFLQDWNIKLTIEPGNDDSDTGAQVTYHSPEKEAIITIFRHSEKYNKDSVSKVCETHLLLHELFHIKLDLPYDYYDNGKDTIEKREFYNNNHQLVDSMAKSVLMIQYNLDFSWFKNY